MKPLMSRKVKRGETLSEWLPAESQMTVDGLNAFAARQRQRIEAAQRDTAEAKAKTVQMRRKA